VRADGAVLEKGAVSRREKLGGYDMNYQGKAGLGLESS
jgi:hypothetical protein